MHVRVLLLWALAVTITGGFRIEVASIRISSRNASRIFLFAALPAALAWRLAYRDRLERWLQSRHGLLRTLGVLSAAAAALGILAAGVLYGSRTAAASDPSGYVSQSALWARGNLKIDQQFASTLPWPEASPASRRSGTNRSRWRDGADVSARRSAADGSRGDCSAPVVPTWWGRSAARCSCSSPFSLAVPSSALRPRRLPRFWSPAVPSSCSCRWCRWPTCPRRPSGSVRWPSPLAGPLTGAPGRASHRDRDPHPAESRASRRVPLADGDGAYAAVARPGHPHCAVRGGQHPRCAGRRLGEQHALRVPLTSGMAISDRVSRSGTRPPTSGTIRPGGSRVRARSRSSSWPRSGSGAVAAPCCASSSCWWASQPRSGSCTCSICRSKRGGFCASWCRPYPIVFLLCADAVVRAAGASATVRVAALAAFTVIVVSHVTRFIETRDVLGIGSGEQRYVEPALHPRIDDPA